MLPTVNDIVVDIFTQLDFLLKGYVHNGYNSVVDVLRVPIGIAVTLYCCILLYSWHVGSNNITTKEVVNALLKVTFVCCMALNWDFFSEYIITFVSALADEVGGALIKAAPIHMPAPKNEGIAGNLQMILSIFMKFSQVCFKAGSFHNVMPLIEGAGVFLSGTAITLVAVLELTMAKIFLSLLFTMAPLFSAFALFKPTQGIFDNWIKHIAGFTLMMIFVSAVIGFVFTLLELLLPLGHFSAITHIQAGSSVIALILAGLGVFLLLKAANEGQAIANGFVSSSGSAMVGAMIGGAFGSSMKAMRIPTELTYAGKSIVSALGAPGRFGEKIAQRGMNAFSDRTSALKKTFSKGE